MTLFADPPGARHEPLAARMRPRTLEDYVGQDHIVGPGRLLRRAIQADQLSSLILYGPPGTGKTTLAMVVANTTRSHFESLNAVLAGVADIRRVTAEAQKRRQALGLRTTLFVDEVHRWNKAQQDALLPWVENGTVILIGATTENPFFSVNRPLVSRSHVFQLSQLTEADLREIALRAVRDKERGYGDRQVDLCEDALAHLVDVANGDARGVLNALELAVETTPPDETGTVVVNLAVAEESIQRRAVLYDKEGDVHYDTISAFIKSLRGSDPDAAMYWLAKMVYAGEDPDFIFRRMLIFAGEDVGLADPAALGVVVSCAQAFDRVGLPEGRFHLAEAALYLATAPKSNSTFAFFDALSAVENERTQETPAHLKDSSRDSQGFGHGEGYLYPHAYRDHWVAQQYLPTALQGRVFYQPSAQGHEKQIGEEVARRREAQLAAMVEGLGASPVEALTTSPCNPTRERWLQRTIGGVGERLAQVRDSVLDGARLQRHHLAIDLNAGTGLLTWDLVRRVPEGRVWTLARDPEAGKSLSGQAAQLDELARPAVLVGAIADLPALLAARGEADVRFDAAVGRGALAQLQDKPGALALLAERLRGGSRLSLFETVPRHSQRLYALADISSLEPMLAERLAAAEEAIYEEPGDPLVNWDGDQLEEWLADAGFGEVAVRPERQNTTLHVGRALLERWFAEKGEGGRMSYAQHLLQRLSVEELALVRGLFQRELLDKTINWRTRTVLVTASRR
ncbi:MAG: AAA family ATPase [Dehalococcoidales bacterium]|nr:AAA family ATPase [Dehalococcoidales bacterium]